MISSTIDSVCNTNALEQLAKESCDKNELPAFFNGTWAFKRTCLLNNEGLILELMNTLHTDSLLSVIPATMKNFGWSIPSKFFKKNITQFQRSLK